MNKSILFFSICGAIGSILIAINVSWILFGFCFYAVSNVGFLASIALTKTNQEQLLMWIVNTIITAVGLINYSGIL